MSCIKNSSSQLMKAQYQIEGFLHCIWREQTLVISGGNHFIASEDLIKNLFQVQTLGEFTVRTKRRLEEAADLASQVFCLPFVRILGESNLNKCCTFVKIMRLVTWTWANTWSLFRLSNLLDEHFQGSQCVLSPAKAARVEDKVPYLNQRLI